MHAPAQCAGKFFFRGTGLPTVMRKNQPLVPRSNFGGKACARSARWFRGQTLSVPRHGVAGEGKSEQKKWCNWIDSLYLTAVTELCCREPFNRVKPQWITDHMKLGSEWLYKQK